MKLKIASLWFPEMLFCETGADENMPFEKDRIGLVENMLGGAKLILMFTTIKLFFWILKLALIVIGHI